MKLPVFSVILSLSAFAPYARAIEVYASSPNGAFVTTPVYYRPVQVNLPTPMYTRSYVPVTTVHVTTETRTQNTFEDPSENTTDLAPDAPTHPQTQERRDPTASVFLGAGYGGMTGFNGAAASTYRLHLGLGLGATELGLRADIANRALNELANTQGGVWLLSAEVAHRFLQGSTLRPVLGASFDRWQIEPDGRQGAGAFGLGARAGVEVHYHVNPGAALVFGADLGYHRLLASVDAAAVVMDVLTFGATVDIRL